MAKKGKMKISKVKRNNQTTNKMKKQGKLKLQRHRDTPQRHKASHQQPQEEYSSDSEASGEEWRDMLDEEEQQYIVSRISRQPQLLADIPDEQEFNKPGTKRKSRKEPPRSAQSRAQSDSGAESDAGSDVEARYERELAERPPKRMRALLPVKTRHGVEARAEEVSDSEPDEESKPDDKPAIAPEAESADSGVSGEEGEGAPAAPAPAPAAGEVSAVRLLAARRDRLQHEKLRIGALCSSLLECPQKKLKNLYPILYLMEERLRDDTLNLHSVRKLATLSACEVFCDLLPDYPIRHQDYSGVKLKKDTLALYKYEKEMLEFYKRYLQRLEKAALFLRQKRGDTRRVDEAAIGLALISLQCMCRLLVARPQFNYATNVAQSVVPYLGCRHADARRTVTDACATVFADDRRGEITLTIVRLINQLVRRRGERLSPSALDCLLRLRISDVDLDAAQSVERKKKADERHKKRIINLSKKEKKRAKKLKEVERELLETEARESETAHRKQLAEVVKAVFHIYFRLLKEAPRSRLLEAALDGIAKFTHVINLEYYSDLVAILARLVEDEELGARTRLLVVRAVLAVLGGAGDALNVDPAVFHRHLYRAAIGTHAGKGDEEARLVVEAVWQVCGRARRVSPHVVRALAKRVGTLAAQVAPHAALACLALLTHLASQSKAASGLLEMDAEAAGSGRFDPFLESPEHCNAHCAALHELGALARHYHPAVRDAAAAMLRQRGAAAPAHNKLSPIQILEEYDGSRMAFKPPVPPRVAPAKAKPSLEWAQPGLRRFCEDIEQSVHMFIPATG